MRVQASVDIAGPLGEVWAFVEDEANFAATHPNVLEHRIIVRHASGGHDCVQVCGHAEHGRHEMVGTCLDYQPLQTIRTRVTREDGTHYDETMSFSATGGVTQLTIQVEVPRSSRRGSKDASASLSRAVHAALEDIARAFPKSSL